jgi:crotonobetainyl-CoA:carnitine CoA-transferase CaiB-like acyl-CoA transferase
MWAAMATLAALYERKQTGRGKRITTSLYETGLMWMCSHIANYSVTGEIPERCGSGAVSIVPYEAFETKDGYLVIAAGNDQMFTKLATVLGQEHWLHDSRFGSNSERVKNRESLIELINAETIRLSQEQLAIQLRKVGVPCSELQDVAQVVANPQTLALEMLQDLQADIANPKVVASPMTFDALRLPMRNPPPTLGEHTMEILEELGLKDHQGQRSDV